MVLTTLPSHLDGNKIGGKTEERILSSPIEGMLKFIMLFLFCLLIAGCGGKIAPDLSQAGYVLVNPDQTDNADIRAAFYEFQQTYQQRYIDIYGPGDYKLAAPLIHYATTEELAVAFDPNQDLKSQYPQIEGYLFPVIHKKGIVSDYYVRKNGNELVYEVLPDPADLSDSSARQVYEFVKENPKSQSVYNIIKETGLPYSDCYLITLIWGPEVLLAHQNGVEISMPLTFGLQDNIQYLKMSRNCTEDIKSRLVKMSALLQEPLKPRAFESSQPAFDPSERFAIWYDLGSDCN